MMFFRQDLLEGLAAGADDYLTKPFDPGELRARIHVGQRTPALIGSIKQLTGLLSICSDCITHSLRSELLTSTTRSSVPRQLTNETPAHLIGVAMRNG